jgi:uncharacterized protein (TIGR02391 family)
MDYKDSLSRLEELRELLDRYKERMYSSDEEVKKLHQQVCEKYGEVKNIIEHVVGRDRISVPIRGNVQPSIYTNFIEAGFLSGRSIHAHQGYTQLLQVIGHVKRLSEESADKTCKQLVFGMDSKVLWDLIHPEIVDVAKKRFEDEHYADAVLAALTALNSKVKKLYKSRTGEELDGVNLMRKAFSPKQPIIVLDDLSTDTGKNIQQGYMDLFAGSMAGIRNPKAHEIIDIDAKRAIHHLFLTSLLFFKLDELK